MTTTGVPSRLKRAMRAAAVEHRRLAHQRSPVAAAEAVRAWFVDGVRPPPGKMVSAYWPMGDELDVRPLIAALPGLGCEAALPVVTAPRQPLEFRIWRPGDRLEPGTFGTWHPTASAPAVRPDILLVPLLSFDRQGNRLGYGGGFYDRTLAALRATATVTAIGVAYAAQLVASVPTDVHDQRLDLALTEEGIMEFEGER